MSTYAQDFQQWLHSQLLTGAVMGPSVVEAIAAALLSDCMTMAEVAGADGRYFPTDVVETIATELILYGDTIWSVGRGELEYVGPDSYSILDGRYLIDGRPTAKRIFHCRYRIDRKTGRGLSPLDASPVFQTLLRNMEKRMEEESSIGVGHLVPMPLLSGIKKDASSYEKQNRVTRATKELRSYVRGIFAVVKFGKVNDRADPNEYQAVHYGPKFLESNLGAADRIRRLAVALHGLPQELIEGGGSGLRESLRFYINTTLPPYGKRISSAAAKAQLDVEFDFARVRMADVIAMGRVFNSFVDPQDKMTREEALAMIGLEAVDD